MKRPLLSVLGWALCLLLLVHCSPNKQPDAVQPSATKAQAVPLVTGTQPAAQSGSSIASKLPPSQRVFAVDLDADGTHDVLGANGSELWAARPNESGGGQILWRIHGQGVVQKVAMGSYGGKRRLFAVWGRGRGHLKAHLRLVELDPVTGVQSNLWRFNGPRNDATHLSVDDVDGDGTPDIAFSYFVQKYAVASRSLRVNGTAIHRSEDRMATSFAFGDFDGDGRMDRAVGRMYGDTRTAVGDLKAELASSVASIPTEGGVRAIAVTTNEDGPTALLFADGWSANYGKEGRARLKIARYTTDAWHTQTLFEAPEEFTFFEIAPVDADGDGVVEILLRGSKWIRLLKRQSDKWVSVWKVRVGPVLNTAVGINGSKGALAFVPGAKFTTVHRIPGKLENQ